ncbi:MAG: alanine/glycine:cation symporter family protein [Phocaeicola sp.]
MTNLPNYISQAIDLLNNYIWSYLLIALLLGAAAWFTIKSRFVQFRMFGEMCRAMFDSTTKQPGKEHHISSFQAFAISIASRVGTGNLAGVATAITLGGPGAIFWMWVIALLGASSAFIESTLAQLYKEKDKGTFIGGPAFYMRKGLNKSWMGTLFAILITFSFGFAFNSVQSNTICHAFEGAFQIDPLYTGVVLTILTLLVIFGGIQRIAKVSSIVVPIMAISYVVLALGLVIVHIHHLPSVIELIVSHAFGWEQAVGGGMGVAIMQGIRRGLFSNEAGMGSAPNAAAAADVSHPVKQGLIQTLAVFTDTLLICTCTAFIILISDAPLTGEVEGIQLTQMALQSGIGEIGSVVIAIAILFFAYSSILGNYYYGEANVRYLTHHKGVLYGYRLLVGFMVLFGSLTTLQFVWNLADLFMALMTLCNLAAIIPLGKYALRALKDYQLQKRAGIKDPLFTKETMKDIESDLSCW